MKITDKILDNLLLLSGLQAKDKKEREALKEQLSETLAYVENLEELNTENIKPAYFSSDENKNQVFYDGEKNLRGLKREDALHLAKRKSSRFFKVKRIL